MVATFARVKSADLSMNQKIKVLCFKCQKHDEITREHRKSMLCFGCSVVYYCSEVCGSEDWNDDSPYGHKRWCESMHTWAEQTQEICQLPFTFAHETTSENFTSNDLLCFLQLHNLLKKRVWRKLYPDCYTIPISSNADDTAADNTDDSIRQHYTNRINTWSDYYKYRQFNLDRPDAGITTVPLSIYYIFSTLLPENLSYSKQWQQLEAQSHITIGVLGVEKEASVPTIFYELSHIIPNIELHLILIGPKIPKKYDGRFHECNSLRITLHRGMYHKYDKCAVDLVIGLNAGLAAYSSWNDTLKKLKTDNTPAYFTDASWHSCRLAALPVEGLGIGMISDVIINPFRCPFRIHCPEHTLPCFDHAFIYFLRYE